MKIALGADHRGVEAVRGLIPHLQSASHEAAILGDCGGESCDYPDSAYLVGRAVADGDADRGILICSNGIGVTIAANKIPGVRAALVYDKANAERSRRHNDANVLCLGSETTPHDELAEIVDVWLATTFDGGRHERRVRKILAIERGENPATSVTDAATA